MPRNFYFGTDASIVAGSANFAAATATAFATFGLSSAQASAFGLLNTALQSAYSTSINPATRTPVTIQAKTTAIKNMRTDAVVLAKLIAATTTVTDSQLISLGLLPRSSRAPVPVPPIAPVMEVISVTGRMVKIRVHSATSERRGMPAGAVSANIYSYVGPTAPTDPRDYFYEGGTTRTIVDIQFPDSVASGSTVWLCACWVSRRGDRSVGSTPMSFTLQGGPISIAA